MIVCGGNHAGEFLRLLGNGAEFGLKHLNYTYQENEGGIAEALSLCEDFADGEPIAVILGDNTTDANITTAVGNFQEGALIFLKKVPDPQRFGVPVFDSKNKKKIIKIDEKPKKPKSNYAITGLYVYDNKVFEYIRCCRPSSRGELEITDVNNRYLKDGKLKWEELKVIGATQGLLKHYLKQVNIGRKKQERFN